MRRICELAAQIVSQNTEVKFSVSPRILLFVEIEVNGFLNELERQYREEWKVYSPARCRSFVNQVAEPELAGELLVRLLCVDLELSRTHKDGSTNATKDEDESRVGPSVELFKIQYPELKDNPLGLERLVVLEFALSMQHEEQPPNIDSYLAICPSSRLLRNLEEAQTRLQEIRYFSDDDWNTSSAVEKSRSTVPQASKISSFVAPQVPFMLGRYLLIRYLGRGGMGFVYAAIDLSSTAQVAVKMMRRGDGWSVFRFIEEFRWLNQLDHPNLVKLYAAFAEGEARYFSMEFIAGKNIRQWYEEIREEASDHHSALKKSLGQLASAIHFLHTQGVIHRDIKCSNVMITPRGRTVLLDLGLAIRQADQNQDELPSAGEAMPGTLIYMSPEAYKNRSLTPASDWYSFGMIIYELLAGAVPQMNIDQDNTDGRVPGMWGYDPTKLANKLTDAPPEMAGLCIQLLQLEPDKRPSGEQVLQALGCTVPIVAEPQLSFRGREQEFAALNLVRDRCLATANSTHCVVLSGEAGFGKSALLQTWLGNCSRESFFVIEVKNYRQDYTPNRLMNAIVQELVRLSFILPNAVAEIFRPYASEIGLIFPQIEQIFGQAGLSEAIGSDTKDSIKRDRVERSVGQLLVAMGLLSQIKPLVIAIDDAQWADTSGLRSLFGILAEKSKFHGILVIATETKGVKRIQESLSGRIQVDYLQVEPLSHDVCQSMLDDWSRQCHLALSQAEIKRLVLLSKGSPFLLRELFRSLFDQQIAKRDFRKSEVNVTQLVSRRFARMPKQAELVLQYLAIADQPLLIQQLSATCRLTPRELYASLNALGHQGWIRVRSESIDTMAELASENFRDAIVDTMPVDRLQRRHYRLARVLSSEIDPPWPRIALHYEQAARKRLAAVCHIQAARDAFRIGAYSEALYFIEKANNKSAIRSADEQRKVDLLQAECHAALGNSDIAAQLLLKLVDDELDAAFAVELRFRAGNEFLRNGSLTSGLKQVLAALSKCNVATEQPVFLKLKKLFFTWLIAARPISQTLLGAYAASQISTSEMPKRSNNSYGREEALYEAMMRSVIPLWLLDHDQAAALMARLASLIENTTYSLAFRNQSLLVTGLLLTQVGQFNRKNLVKRLRLGLKTIQQLNTTDATSCHLLLLIWCLSSGRFRIAERIARKAKLDLAVVPSWDRLLAGWYEIHCLWFSGRIKDLVVAAADLRKEANALRQPMVAFWANVFPSITADLVHDSADQARVKLAQAQSFLESESMMQPRCYQWLSTVALELYQGDYDTANKLLSDQWRWFAQSGLMTLGHLALTAFSFRINTDLLKLRDESGIGKQAEMLRIGIARLKQHRYTSLRNIADAYQLILDAQTHVCHDPSVWKLVTANLRQSGLAIYAQALNWHESLYANAVSGRVSTEGAMHTFRDQGCLAPRRMMNLILPLPMHHA